MALDLSTYPPKGHEDRIKAYQRYERLFLGQHKLVFAVAPRPYQMKRYIVANFAGLISRLSADLLFGEQPDFIATQDEEAAREALAAIVSRWNRPPPQLSCPLAAGADSVARRC